MTETRFIRKEWYADGLTVTHTHNFGEVISLPVPRSARRHWLYVAPTWQFYNVSASWFRYVAKVTGWRNGSKVWSSPCEYAANDISGHFTLNSSLSPSRWPGTSTALQRPPEPDDMQFNHYTGAGNLGIFQGRAVKVLGSFDKFTLDVNGIYFAVFAAMEMSILSIG